MVAINVTISTLFILVFATLLVPIDERLNRFINLSANYRVGSFIAFLVLVGMFIFTTGLLGFLYLVVSTICIWGLLVGFFSERRYLYLLALLFLFLCVLLLLLKLNSMAEILGVLCYLCLSVAVLKDLLYGRLTATSR